MIAKIHTSDLQKKWPERFADIAKDLDTSEHALKITCQKLNIMRVRMLCYEFDLFFGNNILFFNILCN